MRDIMRIQNGFQYEKIRRSPDDGDSSHLWLEEHKQAVLFSKFVGEDHEELDTDLFCMHIRIFA